MYEMFRKGKYKNKDKVSELTPLSLFSVFFVLLFQCCFCVFCRRIINESGRKRIYPGSTEKKKQGDERDGKAKEITKNALFVIFPLSFITTFMSRAVIWAVTIMC
jgi:hypothetical protein